MATVQSAGGDRVKLHPSAIANVLAGILVRNRSPFVVGPRSRVRWLALRSIRGGNIRIGRDCIINCIISFDDPNGHVSIGDRCYVGSSHLVCHSGVDIGNDVIVSWGVTIVDHDSHSWIGTCEKTMFGAGLLVGRTGQELPSSQLLSKTKCGSALAPVS